MLLDGTREFATVKYLMTSVAALTLYDYMLILDDEIRYIWRGRKSWIFYLYVQNRILLVGYQLWQIYFLSSPRKSETLCRVSYNVQVISFMIFLLSSDTFIVLRVYAITFRNKRLAVYFGTLILARFTIGLVAAFIKPPTILEFPLVPVDAFNQCATIVNLHLMLIPSSLGTAFELSAFLVIAWYTYRNKSALKFSALVRTIISEATIYFLVMIALQTYIQLSLSIMQGPDQELSFLAYGLITPILTMRFAVSLKRSADPEAGQGWRVAHFSSANFTNSSPATQVAAVRDNIEMGHLILPSGRMRTSGP